MQTVVGLEATWLQSEERLRLGSEIKGLKTKQEFMQFIEQTITNFDKLKVKQSHKVTWVGWTDTWKEHIICVLGFN